MSYAKRKNLTPLRRAHHRVDGGARGPGGQGAPADRLGDLQPPPRGDPAGDRRHHPLRHQQLDRARSRSPSWRSTRPYNTRRRQGLPPGPDRQPRARPPSRPRRDPATNRIPLLRREAQHLRRARLLGDRRRVPATTSTATTASATRAAASHPRTADARDAPRAWRAFPWPTAARRRCRTRRCASSASTGCTCRSPCLPDRFAETVRALPGSGFRGINVTVPHKEAAHELADERSPAAAAIGAANTLTFEDGAVRADNTDAVGVIDALPGSPRGLRRAGARGGRLRAGGRVGASRGRGGGVGLEPHARSGRRQLAAELEIGHAERPAAQRPARALHERRAGARSRSRTPSRRSASRVSIRPPTVVDLVYAPAGDAGGHVGPRRRRERGGGHRGAGAPGGSEPRAVDRASGAGGGHEGRRGRPRQADARASWVARGALRERRWRGCRARSTPRRWRDGSGPRAEPARRPGRRTGRGSAGRPPS